MKSIPFSSEKPISLRYPFQILLICSAVLYLFYPSLAGEVSLLDDRDMIKSLSAVTSFDLIGIFFPHSHEGLYYRPLISVSFYIDRFLWNLDPSIMHLENILLHLANAVLIFLIARRIISKTSKLPLIAALIFGVHPIATESVNWISGRTDLIAVMFVLVSFYFVLCYRSSRRSWFIAASILPLVMGILAKETAIGFIPALIFLISAKEYDREIPTAFTIQRRSLTVFLSVCILSLSAALFFTNYYLALAIVIVYFFYLLWCRREYFFGASLRKYLQFFAGSVILLWALTWGIRKLAFSSQSPNIKATFGMLFADINYTLSLFLRGAGFYAKKFIYPFPLSFVIRDVSPFYTLFGIILLCLVVALIFRKKLPDSLAIAGFWMIAPVLPLTFESIAWTSYAERYVYPAAPFWILSLAGYAASAGFDRASPRFCKWCLAGLSVLIIGMAVSTFERNLVWRTNRALFSDSVEKTPNYKPLRGLYMTALFEKGMYGEALQQYQIAQSIPTIQFKYNPNYDLFYVQILIARKEFAKAELELDIINKNTGGKEPEVYETYLNLLTLMILKGSTAGEKSRIAEKMIDSYDRWYELTKDPMILYREGQFLLSMNKKREAGKLFSSAAAAFPEGNLYRKPAEKLAKDLAW